MKVALDTNVLAYAEGVNGAEWSQAARAIIARIPTGTTIVPVQVLGELFNVLERKGKFSRSAARASMLQWRQAFVVASTVPEAYFQAVDLATDHKFQIWDALIVATASLAGCRLLLSENMHDGFSWEGLTIANPFSSKPHPLLASALNP